MKFNAVFRVFFLFILTICTNQYTQAQKFSKKTKLSLLNDVDFYKPLLDSIRRNKYKDHNNLPVKFEGLDEFILINAYENLFNKANFKKLVFIPKIDSKKQYLDSLNQLLGVKNCSIDLILKLEWTVQFTDSFDKYCWYLFNYYGQELKAIYYLELCYQSTQNSFMKLRCLYSLGKIFEGSGDFTLLEYALSFHIKTYELAKQIATQSEINMYRSNLNLIIQKLHTHIQNVPPIKDRILLELLECYIFNTDSLVGTNYVGNSSKAEFYARMSLQNNQYSQQFNKIAQYYYLIALDSAYHGGDLNNITVYLKNLIRLSSLYNYGERGINLKNTLDSFMMVYIKETQTDKIEASRLYSYIALHKGNYFYNFIFYDLSISPHIKQTYWESIWNTFNKAFSLMDSSRNDLSFSSAYSDYYKNYAALVQMGNRKALSNENLVLNPFYRNNFLLPHDCLNGTLNIPYPSWTRYYLLALEELRLADQFIINLKNEETLIREDIKSKAKIFSITLFSTFLILFIIILSRYEIRAKQNKIEIEKAKKDKTEKEFSLSKIKLLINSLNPHIIGNLKQVLTYYALAPENEINRKEKFKFFDDEYNPYFDSLVDIQKKNFISIQDEIELLNRYASLVKKIRNFKFEILLEEGLNFDIPPLILQPLFENSIQWAFLNPQSKYNIIILEIKNTKDGIEIILSDNGKGLPANISFNKGLSTIIERLKAYNIYLEKELYSDFWISNNTNQQYGFSSGTISKFIIRNV